MTQRKVEIIAKKRTITGAKVKKLRREGQIPASVYGKKVKSENLQIDEKKFLKVYEEAGDTKLVDLKLEGGEKYPVLIHQIQRHPVNGQVLTVDFLAVNLRETIKVKVPVVSIGDSPAVTDKIGALLQPLQEIEIECLPTDLPENLKIDISKLAKIGDVAKVSDIKIPDKIKILTDAEQVVFTISELVQKEKIEEVVTPHEAEATEQKKVEEGEEGEGKGEEEGKPSSAKASEGKKEEKKEEKK